jgi:hypothetical protein
MEQLENNLSQLLNDTINIQFVDDQFASINVKLCSLTEIIGKKDATNSEESQLRVSHLFLYLCRSRRKRRNNSNWKNENTKNNDDHDNNFQKQ